MEYASDAYKEAMKENVRGKSYVWVSLDLVNTYAQESAYISSSFSGSETGLYNDSIAINSVTSTENDGSITFTFGEYTKLLLCGVRFILNETVGSVTATNGTQTKTVTVSDDEVVIDQEFKNCHYIKLTPDSGSLSIKKVYFGKIMNFDHDVIMNTGRRNQIMHLNEELPLKEFSFTVHNYDRLWNKDNPDSYAKYLCEKQKIKYRYGRQIDENTIYKIVGGVVYLKDFTSDDYKASFSGIGLLDYLQDDYSKGTIYPDGITLYQLAEMVMIDAGITNYELDACLRTFKVTNPLPIDTHKACLQLIAHAGKCVLFEDRNGAVCLKSVDRPVIYKTGYVINATGFSSGDDVVNPTTVANYASTEPSYTYADGLQYFFPEGESHEEPDIQTNYITYPYDSSSIVVDNGVRFDVLTNGEVIISGVLDDPELNPGDSRMVSIDIVDENTPRTLTAGKYILCSELQLEDSSPSLSNDYGYTFRILDTHGTIIAESEDSYQNRIFELNAPTQYFGAVIFEAVNEGREVRINVKPQIYKFVEVEDVPDNTLPVGFVSQDYASSNGTFTNTPKIEINFTSPCKLTELVMNCAVAPKDFTIKCYKDNTQVATRSITDNTNPQIDESFTNLVCDKFDITFTKTTPGQRIHVNSVEPVAAVDYEVTYKDMTTNPIASEIEKVSRLECELYKFADPRNSTVPTGNFTIQYNEIEGGGVSADITSGTGTLALVPVTQGVNTIDIGNASIIDNVIYSDGKDGGTVEILEKGAYYVKINCSRDGEVTVSGTEFVQSITDYYIPVNEIGNAVKVSNPLISTEEHYNRLKDWFLDYYENDIEYRFDYRGDPVIDADDQIFIENKFVENNLVRIESEELSTSAGMDTNNQIVARRLRFTEVSKTVLRDFVLSNELLYLSGGQSTNLKIIEWIPETAIGKTVTWSSSDTSIATVDSSGVVTPVDEGEVTITVTSANGIVHTCRVISSAPEIPVTDFTLSASTLSLGIGDTQQLSVVSWTPADASHKTVLWTTSDNSIASVNQTGLVTAVSDGEVTITATCPDGISKTCAVTVAVIPATDFTLSESTASVNIGETLQLSVTSWTPANTTYKTITWTSSDQTKATVSSSGLVTTLAEGDVTITATCADGISKTCAVTVGHIAVTNFTLSDSTLSLLPSATAQLSVTSWTPSNATYKSVVWTSSNDSIATVSSTGLVTSHAEGSVTITATCPDGVYKTCAVTVSHIVVTDFTLSSSSESLHVGDTVQLSVTAWTPSNATYKTVTWSSSDTSIAAVSATGLVTSVSEGSVIITATCPDGVSKTCEVTVDIPVVGSNIITLPYVEGYEKHYPNATLSFTVDSDGVVNISGSNNNTNCSFTLLSQYELSVGNYILGGKQNLSDNTDGTDAYIIMYIYTSPITSVTSFSSERKNIVISSPTNVTVSIIANRYTVFDNVKLYPKLFRLAD